METVDLYLRLSDLRNEEALRAGGSREAKLRAKAAELGLTVHRVIIENDMKRDPDGRMRPASAFKRRKIKTPSGRTELRTIRPGFREILDDITLRGINGMLAEDLDRAVRDPRDLEDLIDACEQTGSSARSLTSSLTLTYGGTDAEITMARNMVAFANKSSRDTSRRVKAKKDELHGQSYFGGKRPFGYAVAKDTKEYHRTLIIVPDEAAEIRAAADAILNKGISLRAVVLDWRTRGVSTVYAGNQWSAQTLKKALLKPTIAGLQTHNGELKEAPWDSILDRDTWERLCAKLNDPSRSSNDGKGREPRWLVSKYAKCGVCNDGTTMVVTGAGDKRRYACQYYNHLGRKVSSVDPWVERNVTAYIAVNGMNILKPEPREEIDRDKLQAERKKLRERQATQLRLHTQGLIDDNILERELRYISDRLTSINAQLAHADKPDPLPEFRHRGPTRQIWVSLSMARKRAIVKALFDITILPTSHRGPGFDPDSVRITVKETGETLDVRQWT